MLVSGRVSMTHWNFPHHTSILCGASCPLKHSQRSMLSFMGGSISGPFLSIFVTAGLAVVACHRAHGKVTHLHKAVTAYELFITVGLSHNSQEKPGFRDAFHFSGSGDSQHVFLALWSCAIGIFESFLGLAWWNDSTCAKKYTNGKRSKFECFQFLVESFPTLFESANYIPAQVACWQFPTVLS